MIIQIDQASAVPAFEQLRQQVATMIEKKVLRAGDRMPSIRQLANDLRLAPGTVNRAIRELELDGYLETKGHRGTYVVEHVVPKELNDPTILAQYAEQFVIRGKQLGANADQLRAALAAALKKVAN